MLNNRAGYRLAVIVNDMASVNVDAELVALGLGGMRTLTLALPVTAVSVVVTPGVG